MRNRFCKNLFILVITALVGFMAEAQSVAPSQLKNIFLRPEALQKILQYKDPQIAAMNLQDQKWYDFVKGYSHYTQLEYDQAEASFLRFIKSESHLLPYAYYYLGEIALKKSKSDQAEKYLLLAMRTPIQRDLQASIRFSLALARMDLKKSKAAYRDLIYVERKWRGDPQHPDVLWNLVKVEIQRQRSWRSCRWLKKIYKKYPDYEKTKDWGLFLEKNSFENQKLHCLASFSDKKSRIRRLQWAGMSEEARREIEQFSQIRNLYTDYDKKSLLAEFLLNEGFVEEGLNILVEYQTSQGRNPGYFSLLAKALSLNHQPQKAVGAFYKSYQLNPRSKSGRKALFQAAFLSYQNQDYDGAIRKFDEFLKKFRRSGLRRDVMWYRAWSSYLKEDFAFALTSLKDIKRQKLSRRTRRYWRKFPIEKLNYWLAMTHLKLDQLDQAQSLFTKLNSDKLMGYYSLLSEFRIQQMKPLILAKTSAEVQRNPNATSEEEATAESTVNGEVDSPLVEEAPVSQSEEEESEESLSQEEGDTEEDPEDEALIASEEGDSQETMEQLGLELQQSKNKKIKIYYNRAQELIYLGLYPFVKWELYEIERRTSKKAHLKSLLESYNQIEAYNRSAYIAQVYFGSQRGRSGIHGAKNLWQSTYPKAYEAHVKQYSDQFHVPREMIWAIMRAESTYKKDIHSPVGARGLMQLMPNTGKQVSRLLGETQFEVDSLLREEVNIKLGTRYLRRLANMLQQQWPLVAAGYNAGPHRVAKWLKGFGQLELDAFVEHIPYSETRNYVKKVMRNYSLYQKLYGNEKALTLAFMIHPIQLHEITAPQFRETW